MGQSTKTKLYQLGTTVNNNNNNELKACLIKYQVKYSFCYIFTHIFIIIIILGCNCMFFFHVQLLPVVGFSLYLVDVMMIVVFFVCFLCTVRTRTGMCKKGK